MMLDMKRTFDEIVEQHADPDRAAQILANPFYQSLSSGFAGTQEYMAMEKLGQLRRSDEWDLIVVDTPPSRSALDFLDAPQRLSRFLDGRLLRLLTAPAKVGGRAYLRVLNAGFGMVTGVLTKILGAQVLRDVQTFVSALDTMFGGFRERADYTYQLLRAPGTSFLVIAAPEPDALREASYFVERLAAERMPLAGLVLNRVHELPAARLSAARSLAAAETLQAADGAQDGAGGHALAVAALRLHAGRMELAASERRLAEHFTAAHPHIPVVQIPAQPEDVHDLDGLRGDRREFPAGLTGPAGVVRERLRLSSRGAAAQRLSVSWRPVRRRCARTCYGRSPAVRARSQRPGGAGAAPCAPAQSSRPTHRTQCGCPARPRGTQCGRGSRGRSAWPGSAPPPGRKARQGPCLCTRRGRSSP